MVAYYWITVRRPGLVPEKKTPRQSDSGVTAMLREIHALYPDAETTVVELLGGPDIWLTDGREWVAADAAAQAT